MNSEPPRNRPEPRLRDWYHRDTMGKVSEALMKALHNPEGSYRSCLNCASFDEASEQCKAFGGRPPARVIVYGCGSHTDTGDIPF